MTLDEYCAYVIGPPQGPLNDDLDIPTLGDQGVSR